MSRTSGAVALAAAAALALPLLAAGPAAAVPRASAPHTAVANFGYDQGWRTDKHLRLLADLNADGRADIVGFGDAGVYTGLGRADGAFSQPVTLLPEFGYDQGWRVGNHPRSVADVTGDGFPDIVGIGNDGVWTAVGLGDGAFVSRGQVLSGFGAVGSTAPAKVFVADTDGDHRADLVRVGDSRGVEVAAGQANGRFGPPRTVSTAYDLTHFDAASFRVVDVTGDGKAEILANRLGSRPGLVSSVPLPDGTYSAPQPAGAGFFVAQAPSLQRIADVTGDGRADLVEMDTAQPQHGTYVARSLGNGTFGTFALASFGYDADTGWDPARHVRTLANLDGDGRADIVAFGDVAVYHSLALGDGTFSPDSGVPPLANFGSSQGWVTDKHPRELADVTGDGRADIVGFGDAGVYTALGTGSGGFVQPPDPPVIVAVPDVRGETELDATDRLNAAGFVVDRSNENTTECSAIGTVVSQTPAGGARVEQGSHVLIRIGVLPPRKSCT